MKSITDRPITSSMIWFYNNKLTCLFLLCLQGRPGPKGDPGDSGLAGLQVSTPPFILWFMNRKQENIHREQRCY